MNKRPKSREETPKEGSDNAKRYRTATICDRAAQSARLFELVPVQCGTGWRIGNTFTDRLLFDIFQWVMWGALGSPRLCAVLVCQKSQLRDISANQKSMPKRSHSETRFESSLTKRMGITWPSAVRGGPD